MQDCCVGLLCRIGVGLVEVVEVVMKQLQTLQELVELVVMVMFVSVGYRRYNNGNCRF